MHLRSLAGLLAGALAALAIWPVLASHESVAATPTPAPLMRDYLTRDAYVAFYEREVKRDPADQIKARMLAQLYMQRYRERYDANDVARAVHEAQRSIALQRQGNTSAQMALASAYLSYHEFDAALVHERSAWEGEPYNASALAQIASIQMEVGKYDAAAATLATIPRTTAENPTVDSVRARYDQLTGRIAEARSLIDDAIRTIDSDVGIFAYDRSWFHMRAAQLAFESGDFDRAEREFATSLEDFPDNAMALLWQARMFRAQGRWHEALAAATRSAQLYPVPQALGYQADAQRALGDAEGARRTDALLAAEQRIFDTRGVNDRLLANYYAQRHEHLDRALAAARSDYHKRGDEVYADDSLAWVLATLGHWQAARVYAQRAVRYGTQDAQLQYHAAIVALHTGHRDEAKSRLQAALDMNPQFDPFDAPDARKHLAALQ